MDQTELVKRGVKKVMEKVDEFVMKITPFPRLFEQVHGLVGLVKKILQMAVNLLPNLPKHVKLFPGHVVTMLGLVAVADMVFNTAKYVVLAFYLKKAAVGHPELAESITEVNTNLDNVASCLQDANQGFDELLNETLSLCDPAGPADDDQDQLKTLRDGIVEPGKGLKQCFAELRKSKALLESIITSLGKETVFQDSVILHILGISSKNKDGSESNEVNLVFLKEPGAATKKIGAVFSFFEKIRGFRKKIEGGGEDSEVNEAPVQKRGQTPALKTSRPISAPPAVMENPRGPVPGGRTQQINQDMYNNQKRQQFEDQFRPMSTAAEPYRQEYNRPSPNNIREWNEYVPPQQKLTSQSPYQEVTYRNEHIMNQQHYRPPSHMGMEPRQWPRSVNNQPIAHEAHVPYNRVPNDYGVDQFNVKMVSQAMDYPPEPPIDYM